MWLFLLCHTLLPALTNTSHYIKTTMAMRHSRHPWHQPSPWDVPASVSRSLEWSRSLTAIIQAGTSQSLPLPQAGCPWRSGQGISARAPPESPSCLHSHTPHMPVQCSFPCCVLHRRQGRKPVFICGCRSCLIPLMK